MSLRVILITGANGGLGHAIAHSFLRESSFNIVWLGVRSNRERADQLAKENHGRCFCITLDVTSPESWQQAVKEILARANAPGQDFATLLDPLALPRIGERALPDKVPTANDIPVPLRTLMQGVPNPSYS